MTRYTGDGAATASSLVVLWPLTLAVGFGRHPHCFGEKTREIIRVFYAELQANLGYGVGGGVEQFTGTAHLHQVEVLQRAVAGGRLEFRG